jgi:hypothetical protein
MQCKKSQHNGILKELFANIITFKKKLDEHFENSIRHKTRAIAVLNIREIRITSKLSMDMAFSPWQLDAARLSGLQRRSTNTQRICNSRSESIDDLRILLKNLDTL